MDNDRERKLCDVQHVRDLGKNLFLIKMMDKLGYSITFGGIHCRITKIDLVVEKEESYGALYHLFYDIVAYH